VSCSMHLGVPSDRWLVTVGSGHALPIDCAPIAQPTVGLDAISSPVSPVNFSLGVLDDSREQRVCR
jgi:hypothetical protein